MLEKQSRELAQQYSVRGLPALIVLDREGDIVGRHGFPNRKTIVAEAAAA